ncbi:MAG: hypothetical protein ACUVUS_08795 [Thermoproteota archaeon]
MAKEPRREDSAPRIANILKVLRMTLDLEPQLFGGRRGRIPDQIYAVKFSSGTNLHSVDPSTPSSPSIRAEPKRKTITEVMHSAG